MAKLGIDFGTTNTVAVIEDRGMFSVVRHEAQTASGTIVHEVFPSSILVDPTSGEQWFGLEAERQTARLGRSSKCVHIGSLKRQLRHYAEGRRVALGGGRLESDFDLGELLTGFLRALADSIRTSTVTDADEPLEAVITWPANANGAQRHVTRQAFRQAGFEVRDSVSEPVAAAIELADAMAGNLRRNDARGSSAVAVFDLGGGTFDASVVRRDDCKFQVLASGGIEELGGDDFDQVLLEAFLEQLGLSPDGLGTMARHALLQHVRAQKEIICTGAVKSLFLNPQEFGLPGGTVSIGVADYYDRIRPLLTPAVAKLSEVIASASQANAQVEPGPGLTIYLAGGSSRLPLVADMVKQAFGDCRIVLSDKPFRSVAMGAALCAVDRVSYRDVFARNFGLMRLRDHGRSETFDTIFPAGTPIPRKGEAPLEKSTSYHPAHNIGHLRYLECSTVDGDGRPAGDTRAWSDIMFPYDPGHLLSDPLSPADVTATDCFAQTPACEVYRCDSDGVVTVELRRPATNDARCYEIYRQ